MFSSKITYTESDVSVSMQLPEALGISGKFEMTVNKNDPSLSFIRFGKQTAKLADTDFPPEFKQFFIKVMKEQSSRTKIEVGEHTDKILGVDKDDLMSLFGDLLSEYKFKVKSKNLLESSYETISIGEYQSSMSGKLLAFIDQSRMAIEIKGDNNSAQFIKFDNSVLHVPTGAPLHQIALEYKMYRTPEGMSATKTFKETECSPDAPEQLSDTISNQLKGASK